MTLNRPSITTTLQSRANKILTGVSGKPRSALPCITKPINVQVVFKILMVSSMGTMLACPLP